MNIAILELDVKKALFAESLKDSITKKKKKKVRKKERTILH